MAPSSSGLGYLVLIQKIAGSNPAGVTIKNAHPKDGRFLWVALVRELKPRSECGGARTRTDACIEHVAAKKDEVRYPAGVTSLLTFW